MRTHSEPSDSTARLRALALAFVPGVGSRQYRDWAATFGSAAHAFDTRVDPIDREIALEAASTAIRAASACDARVVALDHDDYPSALRDLEDAPTVVYVRGDLARLAGPCVAIVGTRNATAYGERVTRQLAGTLARDGVCIVSGLARGIDAAAHRAALEARGLTAGILGTGIDLAYPVGHRSLQASIARDGVLLTEMPCGVGARGFTFPRRNRLIAALARLTIVVEAGFKSGALGTARHANDLARAIAAVPGPIDAPQSQGANLLLRDGGQVIASIDDARGLLQLGPSPRNATPLLASDERAVVRALHQGATQLDDIVARSALPARQVLTALTALELARIVLATSGGEFRLLVPP